MGRNEDGGDREEVTGEVAFVVVVFMSTVNHEFRASLCEDELQELASNARKSVAVGNFRDHALEDAFQKGLQTFTVEVDAASDVPDDDGVSRVRFLEVVNLALEEVATLFGAADAGVDVRAFVTSGVLSEQILDPVNVVSPFASGESEVIEASGGRPGTERSRGDSILVFEIHCRFEWNFGKTCFGWEAKYTEM